MFAGLFAELFEGDAEGETEEVAVCSFWTVGSDISSFTAMSPGCCVGSKRDSEQKAKSKDKAKVSRE